MRPSLWDVAHGDAAEVVVEAGYLLGSARLSAAHQSHAGWPLAGYLRVAGSVSLAARYVFAVPVERVAAFGEHLTAAWASTGGSLDRYWVSIPGRPDEDDHNCVLLLTPDQVKAVQGLLVAHAVGVEVGLASGQIIRTAEPELAVRALDRSITLELQEIRYSPEGPVGAVPDGVTLFQAHPSGRYARRLSDSHSFRVLLSPHHKERFASGFATVRNPLLERSYPLSAVGLPVIVDFETSVRWDAIVIDETIATGVCLRPGEIVEALPISAHPPRLTRGALSFRHSLCRVHGSNTTDMEKPLVRLPLEVFDIIGVNPGARVALEVYGQSRDGPWGFRKLIVRALPWRGDEWPRAKAGVPDVLRETGSQDLPPVSMDLACQQELGTTRGAAIYVRPALGSLAIEEASNGATAVVVGALGAAVLGNAVVSGVFVVVFFVLVGLQLWRRLR